MIPKLVYGHKKTRTVVASGEEETHCELAPGNFPELEKCSLSYLAGGLPQFVHLPKLHTL